MEAAREVVFLQSFSFWLEVLGWTATVLLLYSMTRSRVVKLRIYQIIGCALMSLYAVMISSYSVAVLNSASMCINIYHYWKLKRSSGRTPSFPSEGSNESRPCATCGNYPYP